MQTQTMTRDDIHNVNMLSEKLLITPKALKEQLPLTDKARDTVITGRQNIERILDRKDHRLLVVAGPCSIHDIKAAKEYAQKLRTLQQSVEDSLYIVMRVYFEKPRTTVGWKGLINDPFMDDSFQVEEGLKIARKLLNWINELGLPVATEALDPISPQYLSDLLSWSAIGARTTESQTHREMASGLSMPVGFKNSTDGSLNVAINALHSVRASHNFLGINQEGQCTVFCTKGNAYGHIVLRGGKQPNYDSVNIKVCEDALEKAKLPNNIMVDCSHANSYKKFELQPLVAENVMNQIIENNQSIMGIMLESNLVEGNQKMSADKTQLQYGVSITDACIGWDTTVKLLNELTKKLKPVLPSRIED